MDTFPIIMFCSLAILFTAAMVVSEIEGKPIVATFMGMTAAMIMASVTLAVQLGY